MRPYQCLLVVLLGVSPQICQAWSPSVQGVISLAAVENLSPDERVTFFNLLREHPQYEEMIAPSQDSDPEYHGELITLRAGTWADRIEGTKYDRPKWHFIPGVLTTVGPVQTEALPKPSIMLPAVGQFDPADLNLIQAIKFCVQICSDQDVPDADRAIAMCWLMNLTANLYQPLRLGSLYADPTFSDGDDHGREILIGGDTLFDSVENFPNRGDRITGILSLKREFELGPYWEEDMQELDREVLGAFEQMIDLEYKLSIEDGAQFIYEPYIPEILAACDAKRSTPLKVEWRINTYGFEGAGPAHVVHAVVAVRWGIREGLQLR